MVLTQHKAKHAVAERKHWVKFGAAANARPSFEDGITAVGEEIPFHLVANKVFDLIKKHQSLITATDRTLTLKKNS
jgi:hypothetical protein